MRKPRYLPKLEESANDTRDASLPVHLPVANYYRQSTMTQVGNVSTEIQTVDMAAYLKRLGWTADKIIMIDMDAGISGTKKIDERPGMSQLFRLITTGKVGAVSCQNTDRLFRDVTQIQVNIFIEACRENRVLVITPDVIYNFHHEQMGTFYARQFRFHAEMAAEYITSYVKGRLQKARLRVQLNGRWAGSPMPPGYMADMRKTLPSGAPNPNWRNYVIFEPYAEVAREYWRLFLHFGGQLRPTARHIAEHGPYYPDPNTCKPPEGFKVYYRLEQHNGKWHPTRSGLKMMLTNALYLGHWMLNGAIIAENHHPAMIDPDIFMRAFHYLSDRDLNGRPNVHYAPIHTNVRPSKEEERDEYWPLCAGLIISQEESGEWLKVGTRWSKSRNTYFYVLKTKDEEVPLGAKKASMLDTAVADALLERMSATFDFDAWEETISGLADQFAQERLLLESQMKQLQSVMQNLVASLGTLRHPAMIQAAEKQYAEAEIEANRLQELLATQADEVIDIKSLRALKSSCGEIFRDWPEMSPDEQRQALHTFISRIEATLTAREGLSLCIYWRDDSTSKLLLPEQAGDHLRWTDEENQRLIHLMGSDADQLEVAAAFPNRTWTAITLQYRKVASAEERSKLKRKRIMKVSETYLDYLARIGAQSITDPPSDSSSKRVRQSQSPRHRCGQKARPNWAVLF